MKTNITLEGVTIKRPSAFKIDRYSITKSERLANGKMVMELIAKKRKFYLTYDSIAASELNPILDIIWESDSMFFDFTYVENNATKTATVYVGPITTDLYRTDEADWIWHNIELHFIEQ